MLKIAQNNSWGVVLANSSITQEILNIFYKRTLNACKELHLQEIILSIHSEIKYSNNCDYKGG